MTSLTPSDTINYTYGNADWKDQLTSFDGEATTYDAIGNPLSYRGMTLAWQNGRQLATLSKDGLNANYTYNDAGLRLSKTINGTTTEYYWNGTQLLAQKTGITYLYFLYDETGSAVGYKYNNNTYIYVKNLQGDVVSVIDGSTGTAVANYTYDSWGNILTATGAMADLNPIRYRGYYYDIETSLYYLQSRYYDAQTHRFINADSASNVFSNGDIQGINIYIYCSNNPVQFTDPTGQGFFEDAKAWIEGAEWINDNVIQPIAQFIQEDIVDPIGQFVVETTFGAIDKIAPGNDINTIQIGKNISAGCGIFGTFSYGISFDRAGNIGPYANVGIGGQLGLGASVGFEASVSNAPSIDKLGGPGFTMGGSFSIPVYELIGIGGGIDYTKMYSNPYYALGVSIAVSFGFLMFEAHANLSYTLQAKWHNFYGE